jgi:hemerythrin-like domain-containing protein
VTATSACDNLRADHREMEAYLDHLLPTLQRLSPDLVPQVQAVVWRIRRLTAIHFEKEEQIFYPSLCPALRDLVGQMEQQHEQIRELEQQVAEMLSDPPQVLDSRWLNDLRMFGSQFHDFIQHHIVDEEDNLLRLAESQLTPEDQELLAAEMIRLHDRRIVNCSGEKESESGIEGELS